MRPCPVGLPERRVEETVHCFRAAGHIQANHIQVNHIQANHIQKAGVGSKTR